MDFALILNFCGAKVKALSKNATNYICSDCPKDLYDGVITRVPRTSIRTFASFAKAQKKLMNDYASMPGGPWVTEKFLGLLISYFD